MTRSSWMQLKDKKLDAMTTVERVEYKRAFAEAKLAADVGDRSPCQGGRRPQPTRTRASHGYEPSGHRPS